MPGGEDRPRNRSGDDRGDGPGGTPGPVFPGFRAMDENRRRLLAALVAERRARGLTQSEVAARMGTSQSAVARLESEGVDARLSTLQRYVAALDRRLEWRLMPSPRTGGSR